jgi:hypothetical protein
MSESNDHEWILLRERGEDVSHVPAETRAKYERLARLFEALPGETPSAGWKQRVFAALDDPPAHDSAAVPSELPVRPFKSGPVTRSVPPGRPPSRRTWAIVGGFATAAAFGVALILCGTLRETPGTTIALGGDPGVTTEIRLGNAQHRSGSGSVSVSRGDTLVVKGTADRPFELRVYGESGEPIARCTETIGCAVERDGNVRRFHFELTLQVLGEVRAFLFTGASIPTEFQDLNADIQMAQRANVDTKQLAVVQVQ